MTFDVVPLDLTGAGPATAEVLGRGAPRRGRAARLVAALPRPHTVVRPHDDAAAVLTRLYAATVRGRGTVHVVQLTAPHARDVALELATAGWFVGDTPAYRDLTAEPRPGQEPDQEPDPEPAWSPGSTIHGLRTPYLDGAAVWALRRASTAVVVADTLRGGPRLLAETADLLEGIGVAVVGLVVHDGRLRRDPA